jgi:hypothetical protein
MRRQSKKAAKRAREVAPMRDGYLESHPNCAVYRELPSVEIHEITNGANRQAALDVPAALLAVSRRGHDRIQSEPKELQLAVKLCATPDEFDLDAVNRLVAPRGAENVPERFTLASVAQWLMPRLTN